MTPALGSTEVHDLWSGAVNDEFRIFIGHCGADPRAALVVTDANGLFGLAVDTVRLMRIPALVPPLLVVGVGYPWADTVADTARTRTRDLTPTPSRHVEGSGHADDFIRFVSRELRPWLDHRFPSATRDLIYFGHSLGGLFGAYTMLTAASTFDRYILSSPSLWWDDEAIFRIGRTHADEAQRQDVFFGIGSLETDEGRRLEAERLPDGHPTKPPARHLDMVDDLRRFVAQLGVRNGAADHIELLEIADEFHATVPATVLSRALRHFAGSGREA